MTNNGDTSLDIVRECLDGIGSCKSRGNQEKRSNCWTLRGLSVKRLGI